MSDRRPQTAERRPPVAHPCESPNRPRSAVRGSRWIVFLAGLVTMLFASSLFAQLPPGKWWRRPEIVNRLQITEEQQDKLDAVFRGAANELIDLRGEVEKANVALRGEIDQPQLNRQAILRDAARLNEARGRLFSRELAMMVDMRGVLTDAQWNRMREILDRVGAQGGVRGGVQPQAPRRNPQPPKR